MFTKELSLQMLKVIDHRKLTLEKVSEATGLSRKFIGNIINGKQVPTLDSFEKICSALELEPNDLLLNEKSRFPSKSEPMCVCAALYRENSGTANLIPICPSCNSLLTSELQSYCDSCGQRLSWKKYHKSDITFENPRNYRR